MGVKLLKIDTMQAFQALEQEWNQLYEECEDTSIFLSWDWLFSWSEVFHETVISDLCILTVYEDDVLIGIAPFYISKCFPKFLIQGRTLTFIGSGEKPQDKVISQYSDLLVKSDKKTEMVDAVSEYLIKNKRQWDFADFEFLLKDSLISKCFDNDSGICSNLIHYGNRFFINNMEDFDTFQNQMGNRWSKMYRKKLRKLKNDGDMEIVCPDNFESSEEAFHKLSKMHEERWVNRSEFNIFKSELFNQFHLKVLERLVPKERAFIKTLSIDSKPLSSYYCFKDKSQIHYYQSGFYSEYANRYSPLFLLVCTEIGESIKNQSLFDFMFDENISSYKKEQYAASSEPMYRLMCSPYKSRMIRHCYAKKVQDKYLNIRKRFLNS